MRQTIRAFGWAIYALWLAIIVFTVIMLYSAFQIGLAFGEPRTSTSEGTLTLTLPFSVENKGFYDISDLNISTVIHDSNGTPVSNSSTLVPQILNGDKISTMHNISVDLNHIARGNLSYLLFYDSTFKVDRSLALKYARVIWLQASTDFTMPWGAPIYNLTMSEIVVNPYNTTHIRAVLPLSFENHSFFNLTGTIRIEIVNTLNQQVGETTITIDVPSQSGYQTQLELMISESYSGLKDVRLYFDTAVFSYGPVVMPVG